MNIDGPNRREDMGPSIYLMIMLASLDLDHQSLNIWLLIKAYDYVVLYLP